jgi:endopeptidase Clp ATP-binding regulatory subunit ClpX
MTDSVSGKPPEPSENKTPSQKELEQELNDYLHKKYGDRIKIVSPFILPKFGLGDGAKEEEGSPPIPPKIQFNMLPEEMEAYLNEYVIKQEEAKAVLSTKICTHFNRIHKFEREGHPHTQSVGMIKNNILMIGPTGVGKTYLIKLIAKKIGVPFVKGDATKFSETGYVGGDVEDLVRDLLYEANDYIELAQYGIIYIDEIDKIASSHHLYGPDVSRTGVQRALLKPMEETEIDLRVPHDPISQLQAIERYRKTGKREKRTINTRNILFIMSGAFNGLDDLVKKRLSAQNIGFESQISSRQADQFYLNQVRSEDLIKYGFESEFVGRLPIVVVLSELVMEDLYQILKNPNNPIIQSKKRDFFSYRIGLAFEDRALRNLAGRAAQEGTGARGLVSAVERSLIPFEKHLPSTAISRLLVTPELVDDPKGFLKTLLKDPDNQASQVRFDRAREEEKKELLGLLSREEKRWATGPDFLLTRARRDLIVEHHLRTCMDLYNSYQEIRTLVEEINQNESRLLDWLGVTLHFTEAAKDEVLRQALEKKENIKTHLENFVKEYEYGFKLVRDRLGLSAFLIEREDLLSPDGYFNRLLKERYSGPILKERPA